MNTDHPNVDHEENKGLVHGAVTGESVSDDGIRVGSPFAPDTIVDIATLPGAVTIEKPPAEVLADGVMKYTAQGSATASLMVIFFAGAAAWWFPAGGIIIAGLGCALAVGGMFSKYRLPSTGLLVIHMGLFLASYILAVK